MCITRDIDKIINIVLNSILYFELKISKQHKTILIWCAQILLKMKIVRNPQPLEIYMYNKSNENMS